MTDNLEEYLIAWDNGQTWDSHAVYYIRVSERDVATACAFLGCFRKGIGPNTHSRGTPNGVLFHAADIVTYGDFEPVTLAELVMLYDYEALLMEERNRDHGEEFAGFLEEVQRPFLEALYDEIARKHAETLRDDEVERRLVARSLLAVNAMFFGGAKR